jgi:hypothetical protein
MCKEWMPRRVEEFWRVQTKAVVLSPPKQFTWIVTVVTVAGCKTTHFSRILGGPDKFIFLQDLTD